MKQEAFCRELTQLTPDVPECFHQQVEAFLQEKVDQEVNMKESTKRALYMGGRFSSRALIFALIAVLTLGTVAFAANQWDIFDALRTLLGSQPPTADAVMQANLHQETVNGVEITIKEAGYDGRTLFLQYSYRLPEATEPLGETRPKTGNTRWLRPEDTAFLDEKNVGWWIDHFWINGQCMDMAVNSGAEEQGSDTPGEIIRTEYWRLDNIGVTLQGRVEIALPIGQRQPLEDYSFLQHPERYDENQMLLKPEKGLVTFTFDAGDTLSQVTVTMPEQETITPYGTVKVKEAAFTPLMTYITLEMQASDDWDSYLFSLQLVDGNGTVLFPDYYGNNGHSETWAEFTYPYISNLPEQLWLAPMQNGSVDMTCAVRVK